MTIASPKAETFPSRFQKLGLSAKVLSGVRAKGYREPSPIQEKAIPLILQGRDIIGASQTGTGKTAAFALPVLTRLKRHGALRCLVVEPTRELAQQVIKAFREYGKALDLRTVLLHGGIGYGEQTKGLKDGADIVVATPGRLLDQLSRKNLSLGKLQFLILDEADRMLDMGFIPDVRKIIRQCPKKRQSMLFSATMVPEIERIAGSMLVNPERVSIGSGVSPAETVHHSIYPIDDRQKFDLLLAFLESIHFRSVIIFSRTKVGADIITRWLLAAGHKVGTLHSDRSQKERDRTLEGFRAGKVEILVATDIVSRGIDIMEVSHVINYDMPQNPEDYVHRIGRTGRMNNEGDAVTLFTPGDKDFLRSIENFTGLSLTRERLDGFNYNWSPILEEARVQPKKRNRGFSSAREINLRRRRRR